MDIWAIWHSASVHLHREQQIGHDLANYFFHIYSVTITYIVVEVYPKE